MNLISPLVLPVQVIMLCKTLIELKKKRKNEDCVSISATRTSAHIASQESEGYCLLRGFGLAGIIVLKCK